MLNLARAVQGTGGAMMFATSLALIAQAFHGKERGTAFGVFGAVTGAAVAVGPVLGGVITSGIGWEWIFFVNVPIGVIAVFITLTRVADSRDPNATGVDWPGLVTFSGSLFLLVFALVQGNEKGWGSTEIVSFLIGAAVLMVAVPDRRAAPEPADARPLAVSPPAPSPARASSRSALSGSFFAMFLYLTLYIQDVLGYSPLQAGLRFLPVTLLSFIVAPIAGRLSVRVPVRLLLGSGLLLVGHRPADDDRRRRRLGLDRADPRLRAGRRGRRPGQPAAGLHRGRGGARRAQRDGLGHQLDLPPGRHRHRDRRAGRGLPAQRDSAAPPPRCAPSGHAREIVSAAHGQLGTLLESGEVTHIAQSLSPAARAALDHAYRVGFTEAFTTIAAIAAVVALVGAVLAFALVRTRDFVSAGELPAAQEEPEPWRASRADGRRRSAFSRAPRAAHRLSAKGLPRLDAHRTR